MSVEIVILLARVVLAGAFLAAAAGKLLDLDGSRRAMRDFGLPPSLVPTAALLLPPLELLLAGGLLAASTAALAAGLALVLLLAFVAAIGVNLARGRRPECHCFGQLHSEPIGRPVLLRNLALAGTAMFIATAGGQHPGADLLGWTVDLSPFELAVVLGGASVLALLAVQTVFIARLGTTTDRVLAEFARADRAASSAPRDGAPVLGAETPAPPFAAPALDGAEVSLQKLLDRGRTTVLVFVDPSCHLCAELVAKVPEWQEAHDEFITLVLISRGDREANAAKLGDRGRHLMLLERDSEVSSAYGVLGMPAAAAVRPDGKLRGPLMMGPREITTFITELIEEERQQPRSPQAAITLDVNLRDMEGRAVSLRAFTSDAPTIALLWNPACGFCSRILDEVRAWEEDARSAGHSVLVVSTGGLEENRALGFHAPIVLDDTFSVGRTLAAGGTPAAILLDRTGSAIGAPVVGAPEVLGFLDAARWLRADGSAVPRKAPAVDDEMLADGGMMLYSAANRKVLTLNPTGALVWEYCDGEHPIDAIVREVQTIFPAAEHIALDVRLLLGQLASAHLITMAEENGPVPAVPMASHISS